jgi:hypothetical protein
MADTLPFLQGWQASQQLVDAGQENKLRKLMLDQKTREIGQQNALSGIIGNTANYDASGNLKRDALPQIAAAAPNQLPAYQKMYAEQDAQQAATQKQKRAELLGMFEWGDKELANVRDQAGYDQFRQRAASVYPQLASQLPPQFDPASIAANRAKVIPVIEQLKLQQKQDEFAETKRHNQATETNTARGQDMTDARARDANALQGDLKQIQLQNAQDKQQEKEQGKQAAIANAQDSLAVLDKAINHPGRETATGVSGSVDPRNYLPGTDAKNFRVVLDQIKGQAFMQAYQNLRGGGQITEVEGKKATDAIARLDTAQSDKEFVTALTDLRSVMQRGYDRLANGKSGGQGASPAVGGAPKIGSKAEFDALPSGSMFVAPDGTTRRKP